MFDQSMAPELARNLIYTIGWPLLAAIAILPPVLYCKYGVGKPKYLRRIGEYLALRGLTLTAGKRCQNLHTVNGGAFYAIRYVDAQGQEFEAHASISDASGVFIGEPRLISPQEATVPLEAPNDLGGTSYYTPTMFQLAAEQNLDRLQTLQEENRRLRQLLAALQTNQPPSA